MSNKLKPYERRAFHRERRKNSDYTIEDFNKLTNSDKWELFNEKERAQAWDDPEHISDFHKRFMSGATDATIDPDGVTTGYIPTYQEFKERMANTNPHMRSSDGNWNDSGLVGATRHAWARAQNIHNSPSMKKRANKMGDDAYECYQKEFEEHKVKKQAERELIIQTIRDNPSFIDPDWEKRKYHHHNLC